MSHSFKEPTFKGKPVSQLDAFELRDYKRECRKAAKKSIKDHENKMSFHDILGRK